MAESSKRRGKRPIKETPELPEDVVTDIFTRLPVKSLLRFRCVSKHFLALIDGTDFIKHHLNRSLTTKTNHKLILLGESDKAGSSERLYSVDLDELDQALEIDHPFGTEILGSVNGLLCLLNRDRDIFFSNFATRTYHKLPVSKIDSWGCVPTYGFGYDSVSDDYKLFQHVQYIDDDPSSWYSEAEVYSLRSNSWQRIQDFPDSLHDGIACRVLVCGALHWITSKWHGLDDTQFIAAFDLATNGFRVVDHPEFLTKGPNVVTKLEGRLCVPCFFSERVDLWVKMDYGVKESWSKLFSICQPKFIRNFSSAVSLTYSKIGTEIMLLPDYRKLISYSLKEGTVRTIRFRGYPDRSIIQVCVESYRSILQVCVESLVPLGEKAEDFTNKKDGTRKRERERGGGSR